MDNTDKQDGNPNYPSKVIEGKKDTGVEPESLTAKGPDKNENKKNNKKRGDQGQPGVTVVDAADFEETRRIAGHEYLDYTESERNSLYSGMPESKERLGVKEGLAPKELVDLEARREEEKLPQEVEGWIEKREKLPKSDLPGQLPGKTMTTTKVKVPMSRKTFADGFKMAVDKAGRWLSVFWWRLIKIKKAEAEFKDDL